MERGFLVVRSNRPGPRDKKRTFATTESIILFSAMLDTAHVFVLVLLSTLPWVFATARGYRKRGRIIVDNGCKSASRVPQLDPILGLDVAFRLFKSYRGVQRNARFKAEHEEYGLTFQSHTLGKTRIFTIDPSNLRAIFTTNFEDWGVEPLRLSPWDPLVGRGVMDADGNFWRHSREMVQPLFKRAQALDLESFDKNLVRLLSLLPKDGSTVDVQPLFSRLILDFTTEFLFGKCCNSLTLSPNQDAMNFLNAFHYGQAGIGKRTQLPYLSVFTSDKKCWQSTKIVRGFVDRQIGEAAQRSDCLSSPSEPQDKGGQQRRERYVLADELLTTHNDHVDVRNQLLNTFLAAHDTTAALMTTVMFHLARHPTIYAKLRAEIMGVSPKSLLIDTNTLGKLPYLHAVVLETSRVRPVVGQTARVALTDTVLPSGGGSSAQSPVYVRKGIRVQINYFALYRRSKVFGPDAAKFVPERWMEPVKIQDHGVGFWDFLPFSGGPRVCPAQVMAMTKPKYVIAKIVDTFPRLENRDPVFGYAERYRISTDSKNGCKVGLLME